MNEQTETPRTDDQSVRYYDDATGRRIEYVASRFARQLERELTAARAEVATIKEQRDRLAEVLNELWHHYSLTEAAYNLIEKSLATVGIDNQ
jgi:hypothetical protein